MKWIGLCLLLVSGAALRAVLLGNYREKLELGEELCRALDELRQGIFRRQLSLPDVLRRCQAESECSCGFWEGLLAGVEREKTFLSLWEEQCALLPQPYGSLWQDLGRVLTAGDQEEVLVLAREETHLAVVQLRRQKGERDRLVTALCLSAFFLVGIVLF